MLDSELVLDWQLIDGLVMDWHWISKLALNGKLEYDWQWIGAR